MNVETFCKHFATFAEAPNGVEKLRQMILQLAVRGKLVPQEEHDESAASVLAKISCERSRLIEVGEIRRQPSTTPITDSERLFELPPGWRWGRFGDLCLYIESGWSPKCEERPRIGDEWGVIKISAVTWGRFNPDENKTLPSNLAPRSDCEIRSGDFLMSRANTAELVAKSVVVEKTPPRLMLNDKILRVIFPTSVDRKYVNLFNNGPIARQHYMRIASGTSESMRNVSREGVLEMPIPIPPFPEQKRIVAKVDQLLGLCDELAARQGARREARERLVGATLDRLVSARSSAEFPTHAHRLRNNFDQLFDTPTTISQLRQAILRLAVQGQLVPQDPNDEPASLLVSAIITQKELLVRERKVRNSNSHTSRDVGSEKHELPHGWAWVTLDDVTEIGTGGTPPTGTKEYYEGGTIPWITSAATNSEFIERSEQFITSKAVLDCGLKIYPAGSLVVALYGQGKTRGQVGQLMFDSASNQACAVVSFFGDGLGIRDYVRLLFRKKYHELRMLAAGGAQPNLNGGMIRLMRVPLPPLAEQKRIMSKVTQLLSLCDALEAKLTQVESTNGELLASVVSQFVAAS